jgi:diguanylate cyclase (GGDEF)-like protein
MEAPERSSTDAGEPPRGSIGRRPGRVRRSKASSYALLGVVLGQGAPIGASLLETVVDGRSPLAYAAEHPLLYTYMSVSTGIAFALFGFLLGSVADRLLQKRRALRHVNRRLRWLSEVDALTGILNRRAIQTRLHVELKRAQRESGAVALLMLDLDRFKRVNDTYGHAVGDRVLRRVGRCLRRMARATDSVGRLGGEEFLAVLPATGIAEAQSFAERLRAAIGAPPDSATSPRVTVSIGVLVLCKPDPAAMEEHLRIVDLALYRAKAEGRDRVCLSPTCQDARSTAGDAGGSGSLSPERTTR